jgi:hypothetical protein
LAADRYDGAVGNANVTSVGRETGAVDDQSVLH